MSQQVPLETLEKLNAIFFPHFWEMRKSLRDSQRKLVHYTSAENALRILTEQSIMLRSTVCMNDYSEVRHGHELVQKCLHENADLLLKQLIILCDQIHPGAAVDAFNVYDVHFKQNVYRTYIACLSEHDCSKDYLGRLSMWRAYNHGTTGVALVLNKAPFFDNAGSVPGFFVSPVAYLQDQEVRSYLKKVIENIGNDRDYLKALKREQFQNFIFIVLLFSAICIKHHGFEEEREWRLIYLPGLITSHALTQVALTIAGVPQIAYKLALKDIPEIPLVGIEIPSFLDEIIIGPTSYPYPISEAFADALAKAGVDQPYTRIRYSEIPLRT
jgi:hypothetical protein